MIHDLSETLRAILTQPGLPPELGGAHIVFDRPADTFNPTQTTVDVFLYDLRENLEMLHRLRGLHAWIERDALHDVGGGIAGRNLHHEAVHAQRGHRPPGDARPATRRYRGRRSP